MTETKLPDVDYQTEQPRKAYSFFFHYNKPASAAARHPVLTVHWRGVCYQARSVVINVPTFTRERKQQPRLVVAGKAEYAKLENGVFTLGWWA